MNLFDLSMIARGFPLRRARRHLVDIQQAIQEDRARWQQMKCWEIARRHYEHNPFYKTLVGPSLPDDWSALPIMTKSHFQQPLKEVLTRGAQDAGLHIASTSGASGQPFHFAVDKYCHALTWALVAQRYGQYGLSTRSKQARYAAASMISSRCPRAASRPA